MRKLTPILVFCAGCGGAIEAAPPAQFIPPPPASIEEAAPAGPVESLERDEVLATLDAGLGRFLQRVDVEPELHNGRFKGFRIVGLYPEDYWAGVDISAGDVVTEVNGMPIERETQAYAAFESLRSAKELRVSLMREGRPHELVLPIVEGDRATKPKPAEEAPASSGERTSATVDDAG